MSYQIIGLQKSGNRVTIATPDSARAARTHYKAAQKLPFASITAIDPTGREIGWHELYRLADEEDT